MICSILHELVGFALISLVFVWYLLIERALGLVAASEFNVVSPLSHLPKQEVRDVAKYLGLPNWNAAASPCLRSRLQFGVEATQVRDLDANLSVRENSFGVISNI